MKNLLYLTLFISQFSFAYELVTFSNNRIRTVQEILAETNTQIEDVASYTCDNPDRYKLFAQVPIQNMAKDSLKVISQKGSIYTYHDDGSLTDSENKPVKKVKDKFLKILLKTLKRFQTIPETRKLVEELQYSSIPFYIKLGGNRYSPNGFGERGNMQGNNAGFISFLDDLRPMVERAPFNQLGYGGFILWNPNTKAKFVESDYKERLVDKDLILAHEMYHAYDGMRGLLDRRFVKADDLEFQPLCEYRAVRFENITRKAMGYKYRRFYGDSSSKQKDMLDENDEPIVMPTPCIKWL